MGSDNEERVEVEIAAVYGRESRRGMVRLRLGAVTHIVAPSKARELATLLLEAAGSAEGDEALMAVLQRAGFSDEEGARVLMAMRTERARLDRGAREEARQALAFDQFDPDQP